MQECKVVVMQECRNVEIQKCRNVGMLVFLGFSQFFLVFLGFSWFFLVILGFSQFFLVFLGFSWLILVFLVFFWFFLVFLSFSLVFWVFLGFFLVSMLPTDKQTTRLLLLELLWAAKKKVQLKRFSFSPNSWEYLQCFYIFWSIFKQDYASQGQGNLLN